MNNFKKLTDLFFYLSIITFIIGFNFTDNPTPTGWYQQFMPNLNGRQITDIFFLDSLTGYAVTNNLSGSDTGYILKTTNGGDNWNFNFMTNNSLSKIKFANYNTGYACGGTGGGTRFFCKTTNAGINWNAINTPPNNFYSDMCVLNQDTLWLADRDNLIGGLERSTNGGISWTQQYYQFNSNPEHIYMFNARIGFKDGNNLGKTTDGGFNWVTMPGGNFLDMYFADSLTGWKANLDMKKTTDGGLNWITQNIPSGGNIVVNQMVRFALINKDTLWGVGGSLYIGSGQNRGMLYRTTNSGNNWLFQIPDTSIHIAIYNYTNFINKSIGWAYSYGGGVHTTTGGDTLFLMKVNQYSNNIPLLFKLEQNYPNPFNPLTNFKFQIPKLSHIQINIYDINGRLITNLLNKKLGPGEYQIDFNGNNFSSGVYFYSLFANDILVDTKKMLLVK